jgi:hypothetical protein
LSLLLLPPPLLLPLVLPLLSLLLPLLPLLLPPPLLPLVPLLLLVRIATPSAGLKPSLSRMAGVMRDR